MIKKNYTFSVSCIGVAVFLLIASTAWANRSSTAIEMPTTVAKGTESTIRITISHNGNNWFHYTQWCKVTANGKEIARWDYNWNHLPESGVFTKEIKFKVDEATKISAEASCNVHGSEAPTEKTIQVSE
ncbi:MAG: hypothetical protein A2511_14770 [Deltaproteobacteria bacterium RIFOXYD12_FULL_50_9]|nr:MAG: hypothetical protein A2511_14770 [Deltaproteobacteria bacterium RIFOXYD12_FULL_50_9]